MKDISLIDLKSQQIEELPCPAINLILYLGDSLNEIRMVIHQYQNSTSSELLGIKSGDNIIGLIGIEIFDSTGIITHFGLLPDYQRQGIGSKIVKTLPIKYSLTTIVARADDRIIEFYRKLGFIVRETHNPPCPTHKFLCILKA